MTKSNKKIYVKLLFSICILLLAQGVKSQVVDKDASPLEVELRLAAIDNFNPTVDEEIQAVGVVFTPKGTLSTSGEGYELMFAYSGSIAQYQLSDNDVVEENNETFVDYNAGLLGRIFLTDAWALDAKLEHDKKQQAFGYGLSKLRTQVLESDEVTHNKGALSLIYGHDRSSRKIALTLVSNDYNYAGNNDYASLFSYSQKAILLNLSFRQSSATAWLIKIEASEDDFNSPTRNDSKVYRALGGVNWQFSGKSAIEVLLGSYKRDIRDQDSNSGLSWSVDFNYVPREDLRISLTSSRLSVVGESELADDSVKSDFNLKTTYMFSQQWQIAGSIMSSETKFEETDSSRTLDEKTASLELGLNISTYNNLLFKLAKRNLSTSDELINYKQNEVSLNWHYEF